MIHIILIIIFVSWVFWAFIRIPLSKIIKVKVCAICAAVFGTWILIWLAKFLFNYTLDKLILGILMGQSIAGLMYTYEKYIKERVSEKKKIYLNKEVFVKKVKFTKEWFLLRIFIIIFGTLVVYLLINNFY